MKLSHNTLTVPFEKSKIVSFTSLIIKNIAAPSALARFPAKLICFIAFKSASNFCCLLKSFTINL